MRTEAQVPSTRVFDKTASIDRPSLLSEESSPLWWTHSEVSPPLRESSVIVETDAISERYKYFSCNLPLCAGSPRGWNAIAWRGIREHCHSPPHRNRRRACCCRVAWGGRSPRWSARCAIAALSPSRRCEGTCPLALTSDRPGRTAAAQAGGLKAEVEALRVAILAAGRAPADEDPTLQHFALAAFDRARIAEDAVARWRDSVAASLRHSKRAGTWRKTCWKGALRPLRPVAPTPPRVMAEGAATR